MNFTTSSPTRSTLQSRDYTARPARPAPSKRLSLPLACAMCAALGATSVQAFAARQCVLVAGVVPQGMVICDGEQGYVVSEAELSSLIDEVEKLC